MKILIKIENMTLKIVNCRVNYKIYSLIITTNIMKQSKFILIIIKYKCYGI